MKKEVYTELESESFLKKTLPTAKSVLVRKIDEAVKEVKKIGYPCILKLISPDVVHKTEFNAIRLVHGEEDLRKEFDNLLFVAKKRKLKLSGILVQEFVKGAETIIGLKRDPTFGHVVLFGLGGIFVEITKDVAFRVCPVDANEAERMIEELKAKRVLFGFRNEKPVNMNVLKKTIVAVSQLPLKNPRISELDINPFMINDVFGKVVDARIVFE